MTGLAIVLTAIWTVVFLDWLGAALFQRRGR